MSCGCGRAEPSAALEPARVAGGCMLCQRSDRELGHVVQARSTTGTVEVRVCRACLAVLNRAARNRVPVRPG